VNLEKEQHLSFIYLSKNSLDNGKEIELLIMDDERVILDAINESGPSDIIIGR
jgi:hypothetical protein